MKRFFMLLTLAAFIIAYPWQWLPTTPGVAKAEAPSGFHQLLREGKV